MPRPLIWIAFWLVLMLASGLVLAREAPLLAQDVALEAKVMKIATELRCLVCQNETLAASHADLAVDLRQQIRAQLQEGRSAKQIREYMVDRFGEFVLYRPRFAAHTLLLWVGPFILLLLALWALWRTIAGRTHEVEVDAELSPEDAQRARQLLGLPEEAPRS